MTTEILVTHVVGSRGSSPRGRDDSHELFVADVVA